MPIVINFNNNNNNVFYNYIQFYDYSDFFDFYFEDIKHFNDNFLIIDTSTIKGNHRYEVEGLDYCSSYDNKCEKNNESYHILDISKIFDSVVFEDNEKSIHFTINFKENNSYDKESLFWKGENSNYMLIDKFDTLVIEIKILSNKDSYFENYIHELMYSVKEMVLNTK